MVYPRIVFKASLHSSVCWGSYLRSTGIAAGEFCALLDAQAKLLPAQHRQLCQRDQVDSQLPERLAP